MLNICILTDNSWDNIPAMIRRLRKLSPDCKIHTIYSPKLKNIEIVANKCCLQILRHSSKTPSRAISNILSFCDACFLFHNMIEYNTTTSVAAKICNNNDIPCFVFPEYTKDYYFNESLMLGSFSKLMKTITECEHKKIKFDCKLLNDTTKMRILPSMIETVEMLKESYEKHKKTRQITILYDKHVHQQEKASSRSSKAAAQLEYSNNRINFWKKN